MIIAVVGRRVVAASPVWRSQETHAPGFCCLLRVRSHLRVVNPGCCVYDWALCSSTTPHPNQGASRINLNQSQSEPPSELNTGRR